MPWDLRGNTIVSGDFLGGGVDSAPNPEPLVIKTNGAERMRVDQNGNVGIGTTNPSTKLHVLGTPGFAAVVATFEQPAGAMNFVDLKSSQGGGNYGTDIRFIDSGNVNAEIKSTANGQLRFATNNDPNDRLVIDNTGNVGVGTTNPAGPLHILGPALEPPAGLPSEQNGLLLGLQSTAGYKWIQSYGGGVLGGGALALNPQGNNVGVGTTNPVSKLHVVGPGFGTVGPSGPEVPFPPGVATVETLAGINRFDLQSHQAGENYGSIILFSDSARSSASISSIANGQLRFATNETEALRIDSIGNVGVGTTQPTAKLHIASDGNGVLAESSGNAPAGIFSKSTGAGFSPALSVANSGLGSALQAISGTDYAGRFIGLGVSAKGVFISAPTGQPALQVASGTKVAVVATSQGARALYTEESTEVWFTDYGFGHLQSGRAVIRIDPLFAETVNLDEPYHVFIQAYGNATLYVSQRTASTVEVSLSVGDANVEFSYRLAAKRREYERTRLEREPSAENDPNLYPEKRPEWEAQHWVRRPA